MDIKRIKSAAILIPVIILFIFFAPSFLYLILVLALGSLSFKEYYKMTHVRTNKKERNFGYALNAVSIIIIYFTESVSFAILLAFIVLAFHNMIKNKKCDVLLYNFLKDLLGVVYCAVLPSYIMLIRLMDGKEYIILLIVTVWMVDAFAYYTGTLIGRKKLLPRISPKKTYAGAVGGLIGAIVVTILARRYYFVNFSIAVAVILGAFLSFAAQLGDMFESLIKRASGVKDSGDLIPGHGGLLDRIDSLLFAAPALFYFTMFLNL
jgi:phosphatidate cytidylyltransferase